MKAYNKTNIAAAEILGNKAFKNGLKCIPVLDKEFMDFKSSLNQAIGKESIAVLKGWVRGWTNANIASTFSTSLN